MQIDLNLYLYIINLSTHTANGREREIDRRTHTEYASSQASELAKYKATTKDIIVVMTHLMSGL